MNTRNRILHAAAAVAVGLWLAATGKADAADAVRQQHVTLAGGGDFSVMLERDGTVWAWGANSNGQLGSGDDAVHTSANQVYTADGKPLGNAIAVSAGNGHALAVKADGTVWTWGDRTEGSAAKAVTLNDGSTLSDVIAASAGGSHNLVLRADGTAWSWGRNTLGQLGDATTMDRSSPVQVMIRHDKPLTDLTAVAAGSEYSLALRSDGTVWQWGRSEYHSGGGQYIRALAAPEQIGTATGKTFGDVIQIAAGSNAAYALRSDGTVWTWQAGDRRTEPQQLLGKDDKKLTGIRAICSEADGDLLLTLGSDGLVREWKDGDFSIVLVNGPAHELRDIRSIAAGKDHGLAFAADGKLWVWGSNTSGQLGLGDTGGDSGGYAISIVTYVQNGPAIVNVGAAGSTSTDLLDDGTLRSYGPNTSDIVLHDNKGQLFSVVHASFGDSHSAAVDSAGHVWAWGSNLKGQLGASKKDIPERSEEARQAAGPADVKSVAAGGSHTAALTADGHVLVWGDNTYGQIGDHSNATERGPAFVLKNDKTMLSGVVALSSADSFTLALTSDGHVWSWGRNNYGQLGNGYDVGERSVAAPVVTLDGGTETPLSGIAAIAAGPSHALALTADGRIYSWGSNSEGQLGSGDGKSQKYPVLVSATNRFVAISTGSLASAALDAQGNIWTWGSNARGLLANGEEPGNDRVLTPKRVTSSGSFTSLSLGYEHGLALTQEGAVYMWGTQNGQLGQTILPFVKSPTLRKSPQPVKVSADQSEITIQKDTTATNEDLTLKITVNLKDESGNRIFGQPLVAKVNYGEVEPFHLSNTGMYEAAWTLPAWASSTPPAVELFVRKTMLKKITYKP